MANVASTSLVTNTSLMLPWTLKQITQYNMYCIWNLKPRIQIKWIWHVRNLSTMNHLWIMVLRTKANLLMSHRLMGCKLLVNSIQTPLGAFAYSVRVTWITSARSSSCSSLTYMLRRMDPTPHAVMPRSQRMWLHVSLTSVDLETSIVYCKST